MVFVAVSSVILLSMSDRLVQLKEFFGDLTLGGGGLGWWVFPSRQRPRFVIPTDPRFWQEGLSFVSSRKKRIALSVILKAYRLLRRKPDFGLEGDWPVTIQQLFGGKVIHFAAYVSTPSRFSKYTLVLLSQSAEPLGFAKLSEGQDADKAIEDEVNALTFLTQKFPDLRSFPRVIYQAKGFAVQSPAPSSGHGKLAENAGRIAARLFRLQVCEVPWIESESRRALLDSIHEVHNADRVDVSELLKEMERKLSEILGKTLIREGLTHGDFVSWNMVDGPEGFVFDWEWLGRRAEYHDLFHFLWFRDLQAAKGSEVVSLLSGWQSPEAQSLLKGYQADGTGPLKRDALLYLASCFAFYSRHCIANQNDPLAFPFMIAILKAFRTLAKEDSQMPC